MPRGVYDRSKMKKKGEAGPKSASPAPARSTKTAKPVKAAAAAKSASPKIPEAHSIKNKTPQHEASTEVDSRRDAQLAFHVLGSTLTTLTDAFKNVGSLSPKVSNHLETEISETVDTLSALRKQTFADLLDEEPKLSLIKDGGEELTDEESEEETTNPSAPSPQNAAPQNGSLPQPTAVPPFPGQAPQFNQPPQS